MDDYRIRYKRGGAGARVVKADTVNGFKATCDSYVFKVGGEVVAVIPKANVISIERVDRIGEDC